MQGLCATEWRRPFAVFLHLSEGFPILKQPYDVVVIGTHSVCVCVCFIFHAVTKIMHLSL